MFNNKHVQQIGLRIAISYVMVFISAVAYCQALLCRGAGRHPRVGGKFRKMTLCYSCVLTRKASKSTVFLRIFNQLHYFRPFSRLSVMFSDF